MKLLRSFFKRRDHDAAYSQIMQRLAEVDQHTAARIQEIRDDIKAALPGNGFVHAGLENVLWQRLAEMDRRMADRIGSLKDEFAESERQRALLSLATNNVAAQPEHDPHFQTLVMQRLSELDQHSGARFEAMQDGRTGSRRRTMLPLSRDEILVETVHGYHMVVPGYNVDVAVGIVRDGQIEPWTTKVVKNILKPGDSYVNVGANFGYYSVLGAQLVGPTGTVHAIEANPHVFAILLKSIFWSGHTNTIHPYNFAAYHIDGNEIGFQFDPQFIGGGNIYTNSRVLRDTLEECLWSGDNVHETCDANRKAIPRAIFTSVKATTKRIDSILSPSQKINFLHMDIEGAEAAAILGARSVISANPGMDIVIEWDGARLKMSKIDPAIPEMLTFVRGLGYSVYRIESANYSAEELPVLRRFEYEGLSETGHCDLLLTKKVGFEARIV